MVGVTGCLVRIDSGKESNAGIFWNQLKKTICLLMTLGISVKFEPDSFCLIIRIICSL